VLIAQRRRTGPASGVAVAGALVVALGLGLALQLVVNGHGRSYGDLQPLYLSRGIRPAALPYLDRPLEYPAVIGDVMWLTSFVAHTARTFLYANAVLLAGAAGLTAWLLQREGRSALRFAAAPTLALYAFHNWDLLPVCATVAGLVALRRRAPALAGAAFAVGAFAKVAPGLCLVAIAVDRWRAGERDEVRAMASGAAAVALVVNLPWLLLDRAGWWHWVDFQSARTPTWGSTLAYLRVPRTSLELHLSAAQANRLSLLLLVAGCGAVVEVARRRRLEPAAIAAGTIVVFLLTNKVFSPQYTLWILPFLALLPVRRRWWVGLAVVDLWMHAMVFGSLHHGVPAPTAERASVVGWIVLARAVVLLGILCEALLGHDLRHGEGTRGEAGPGGGADRRVSR
jgi:uncharacterized membrane protein